jgi:HEAT repeat protein
VDSLVAGAERDTSVHHRRLWLEALGNSGHRKSLGVALRSMRYPEAGIRASAVHALRFVDDSAALSALLIALGDPAPAVRMETARSLGLRQPLAEVTRVALAAYRRESVDANRAALLRLAWSGRALSPDVEPAVREAASYDSSEPVRRAARALLSPERPPRQQSPALPLPKGGATSADEGLGRSRRSNQ